MTVQSNSQTPEIAPDLLQSHALRLYVACAGKRLSHIWIVEPVHNGLQLGMRTQAVSVKLQVSPRDRSCVAVEYGINGSWKRANNHLVARQFHGGSPASEATQVASLTFVTARAVTTCSLPKRQKDYPHAQIGVAREGQSAVAGVYLCKEADAVGSLLDEGHRLLAVWRIGRQCYAHLYHMARSRRRAVALPLDGHLYPGVSVCVEDATGVVQIAAFGENVVPVRAKRRVGKKPAIQPAGDPDTGFVPGALRASLHRGGHADA